MTAQLEITTFPYSHDFGGGWGWIVMRPGQSTALATSERESVTSALARAAALRYIKKHALDRH